MHKYVWNLMFISGFPHVARGQQCAALGWIVLSREMLFSLPIPIPNQGQSYLLQLLLSNLVHVSTSCCFQTSFMPPPAAVFKLLTCLSLPAAVLTPRSCLHHLLFSNLVHVSTSCCFLISFMSPPPAVFKPRSCLHHLVFSNL